MKSTKCFETKRWLGNYFNKQDLPCLVPTETSVNIQCLKLHSILNICLYTIFNMQTVVVDPSSL